MAKFDNNPNYNNHKFDNSKSNTTKFMLSKDDMSIALFISFIYMGYSRIDRKRIL